MDTSCSGVRICAALLLGLATAVPAWGQDDVERGSKLPIDLSTALRLADERNLDVAIYVERVAEASARVAEARALPVPTLRIGGDYARHTGNIQETSGQVIDADRASRFTGAGVGLSVEIADAIFAPLVAKQDRAALLAAASANRHEVFVDVAAAYLRLLECRAAREVVQRALERALDLARLTADYAEAGEGLLAEEHRARRSTTPTIGPIWHSRVPCDSTDWVSAIGRVLMRSARSSGAWDSSATDCGTRSPPKCPKATLGLGASSSRSSSPIWLSLAP